MVRRVPGVRHTTCLVLTSMSLGMVMMSPYPDFITLSVLLGLMQVVNVKPYERDNENEPTSNAMASLLYVSRLQFLVPYDTLQRLLQGAAQLTSS